jgi:hypothetical protein
VVDEAQARSWFQEAGTAPAREPRKDGQMTKYLLSVHYVEGVPEPDADTITEMHKDVMAFNEEVEAAGAWVFAGGLEEPHIASVVKESDGEVVTLDGPFPEAKEQLGGIWIIEADSHEAALAWARKATVACRGPVEVRPFQGDT